MANVKFYNGSKANLDNKGIENGAFYIAEDTEELYVDLNGVRIPLTGSTPLSEGVIRILQDPFRMSNIIGSDKVFNATTLDPEFAFIPYSHLSENDTIIDLSGNIGSIKIDKDTDGNPTQYTFTTLGAPLSDWNNISNKPFETVAQTKGLVVTEEKALDIDSSQFEYLENDDFLGMFKEGE